MAFLDEIGKAVQALGPDLGSGIGMGIGALTGGPVGATIGRGLGGRVGAGLSSFLSARQYGKDFKEARQANEQRYQDVLGRYQDRLGLADQFGGIIGGYEQRQQDVLGNLEGFGDSMRRDINASAARAFAGDTQNLLNRGLANTTVLENARRGVEYDRQRSMLDLEDRLAQQRLALQASLSGDILGAQQRQLGFEQQLSGDMLRFMEGRQDAYPNAQLAAQTQQGLASQPGVDWGLVEYQRDRQDRMARQQPYQSYNMSPPGIGMSGMQPLPSSSMQYLPAAGGGGPVSPNPWGWLAG